MTARNVTNAGWDLHCHSAYSDGTESPEGLVLEARRRGLAGVGITDHDTWAGWDEAEEASRRYGVPLVRGTEITADVDGICVHMLGLLYSPDDEVLRSLFETTRENRTKRMKKMVENLSADFPITWDDVIAQVKEGEATTIGRPHIADAMVALGFFPNRSAAFAGTINKNGPYYVPIVSPDARTVVEAVKHAGGVAVIAHPAATSRNKRILTDEHIAGLAQAGLDGLEVFHRDNSPEQQQRLLGLARDLHLLTTGGSDWHGAGKPNVMGENTTDAATVEEIARRGAIGIVR
ncbi:PHP domain-containing protein [Bifidobacterium sp. 82T24]|uniref:PHP domain-containing protein n=1 Tax=Bifidobacterium pluvialisilvae TaxID=2834436 RepID=UPI001C592D07|nr:PHP domain-containing protein [Bifidobacterium pluvialisilvae]MBW3087709.1 PHP domain-containing protein [Bifidobacterium pluvialisilvae]